MYKKLAALILLPVLLQTSVLAEDIGNKINTKEYPESNAVLPKEKDGNLVIEGSVEKNMELNLERCLEIALGNNPQINAAFQDILASDARIKQVWSNYFPQISWQTGYTRIKQLQLSDVFNRNLTFNYYVLGQVTLQQMLYDFGVTQNQATIRRLDYENYKQTLTSVINDVIFQTKDAYYNLLYAMENKRVAEDTVKKFEMFYEQAKAFYQIGMNPKVDVTIAQANLSNSNQVRLVPAKPEAVVLGIDDLNSMLWSTTVEGKLKLTFDKDVEGGNPAAVNLFTKQAYKAVEPVGYLANYGYIDQTNKGWKVGIVASSPTANDVNMATYNNLSTVYVVAAEQEAALKSLKSILGTGADYTNNQNAYLLALGALNEFHVTIASTWTTAFTPSKADFLKKLEEKNQPVLTFFPWQQGMTRQVPTDLMLALGHYRIGDSEKAHFYMSRFLAQKGNACSRYYYCVRDFFFWYGRTDDCATVLRRLYGDKLAGEVMADMACPERVLDNLSLPDCFNCDSCAGRFSCRYMEVLRFECRMQGLYDRHYLLGEDMR